MRMLLEQDRAGTDDFSPLPPLIAWCADLVKPTMRSRQGFCLRQGSLTSGSPGSVYIDHDPLIPCSVEQTTRRKKWVASQQILLKARTQGFHGGLVKGGEKTGERRAMGQQLSTKQGHEWFGKGSEPFVKG